MAEAAKLRALTDYISAVQRTLSGGYASEGSHYRTLAGLLESSAPGIVATSLPTRIECGAPDFVLTSGSLPVGYVEAKDIGKSLDEAERTEQLKRYRASLSNLVLTDYLEFRWYLHGECRLKARLGSPTADGKIRRDHGGIQEVGELLTGFLSHSAKGTGTPGDLARRMARQAHLIRNLIVSAFEKEGQGGSLHGQLTAFRDNLIPDLSVDHFADMYAQTIAYGLFAARCTNSGGGGFTRKDAAYLLPRTNPFLRRLFNQIAGPDLDDRIAWLVDDLAQLLARADMEAILKDFGRRTAREDPVVHFYESFLKEYDPKIRQMRGVYYTPEPVVSYIVRSIDHVLKTRFDRPLGLADAGVYVLDPAVGTATFLYMVIDQVHQAIISQGQKGLWNNYVAERLLPRIFGFELLMAPYAVAHLKLGLLLQETGYEFKSDQRLGIYLTNTLEEAGKRTDTLFARWITDESNAAARVKKEEPIMIVLGNPPYSVSSLNRGDWIDGLLDDYKKDLREKKLNIDDDYIKFIRFAQWRIEETDYGILGFITNSSYLDGLTHRRMRECLLNSFSTIHILNLHGSSRRGEQAPGNIKDENVFDIQQGVAIGIFIKARDKARKRVFYADLWGTRASKYRALLDSDAASTDWQELAPTAPHFFFVPKDFALADEYEQMPSVKDIFTTWQSALNTDRDELFLDSDGDALKQRMQLLFSRNYGDDFRQRYRVYPSSSYDIEGRLDKAEFAEANIHRCLHRPFDECLIYYDPQVTSRPVYEVMRHMLQDNIALICPRQTKEDFAVLATSALCTHKIVTVYDRSFVFPLYLYPGGGEMQFGDRLRQPNLSPEFINAVQDKLSLQFVEDGNGELEETFAPADIFNYAYAVFHSPTYRTRYAEFLKIDFPRLPLTSDRGLFRSLAAKGAELVSLHLMESLALEVQRTQIKFEVTGSNEVEKVDYMEDRQRVYINKAQYFEGVPPDVWSFHIGGYQVAHKWLKDRKGRTLTYDDLTHYQKVIVALNETIRLMAAIDELILGWPLE